MASILNADDGVVSGSAGLKSTADSSGVLALQTNGTTAVTVTAAGNVGIGTTSVTTGIAQKVLQITNGTNGCILFGSGATQNPIPRIFGSDTYDLSFATGVTTGKMVFYTNDTERFRVTSAGQFLVNTTTGYGKFTVSNSSGTGKVLLDNYASVPTTENVMSIYADATNGYIQSYNNAYKNICLVPNGGNVGIGTASPTAAQLVIKGDGATTQIRAQAATNTNQGLSFIYNYSSQFGQINCDESGVNQLDLWYTALNHKFGRNTSSANMTLDSSGNLGIGTAPTTTRLVVQGIAGNYALRVNDRNGNPALRVDEYGSVYVEQDFLVIKQIITTPGDGSPMVFQQGASEKARINASGYLGIGTSSPSVPLHVSRNSHPVLAAFGSAGTNSTSSINAVANSLTIGRAVINVPASTTTSLVGGYGGNMVLISLQAASGVADIQYTIVVTSGWNSATVLFSNTYGVNQATFTFSASGGTLQVSHNHSGAVNMTVTPLVVQQPGV